MPEDISCKMKGVDDMTLLKFVIAAFIANILTVGFHIEIGLGIIFISFQFNGLFFYLAPQLYEEEENEKEID